MLPKRPSKIMLVETEPLLVEVLADSLALRFGAQPTCLGSAEAALDTDLFEPHDLFISRLDLPGFDGLELARRILGVRPRPFVLMGDDPTAAQAVAALRIGVTDFFPKPFDLTEFLDSLDRCLYRYNQARRREQRHRQVRQLARRVIRERRDLNGRVDLICRDLVQAQRRLMTRVLAAGAQQREGV
jgi:DNA-binding NtrC family response regulator